MIKNEQQYKRTRNLIADLEASVAVLPANQEFLALSPGFQKAHLASIKRQLAQLRQEVQEYELLKAGNFDFRRLPTIDQVPAWLIQARIAKGLRQEDLARLLRLKKQQIQQYEATDYTAANLHRLMEIFSALREYTPAEAGTRMTKPKVARVKRAKASRTTTPVPRRRRG